MDLSLLLPCGKILCRSLILFLLVTCFAASSSSALEREPTFRVQAPEADALFAFSQAQMLVEEGDLDGAAAALHEALRHDPEAPYLHYQFAELSFLLDQPEAGLDAAQQALRHDPEYLPALRLLGNYYFTQQQFGEALPYFETLQKLAPDDENSILHLAVSHASVGEMSRALDLLKNHLRDFPQAVPTALALGRLYQEMELSALAEEVYKDLQAFPAGDLPATLELGRLYQGEKEMAKARALYRESLARFPGNPTLLHSYARLLILLNRDDEAFSLYDRLLELYPDDLEAWRKRGLLFFEHKEWRQAADDFSRILEMNPTFFLIRYYLAGAEDRLGEKEAAIADFLAIPEEAEVYEDARSRAAYLLFELERGEEGEALLLELTGSIKARPDTFILLASLQAARKATVEALATLRRAREHYPEEAELAYQQALLCERMGKKEESWQAVSDAIEIDPDHAESLNLLAYSLAEEGVRLDEALLLAQRALFLKEAGHIFDTVGWVFYRMGRYAEASEQLLEASRRLPDDPEVAEHLADTWKALGEKAKAAALYRRLLELEPERPGVPAKLRSVE